MHKSKIIFVLGGIRSGKTVFAIKQAKKYSKMHSSDSVAYQHTVYIATGIKTDKEMSERISKHKKLRPKNWQTIEEPIDLTPVISGSKNSIAIVDCINFWIRNLLKKKYSEEKIFKLIKNCIKLIKKTNIILILISNEIGLSPVAPYKSGRTFQNVLGRVNQIISDYADEVYFVVSGLSIKLK